MARVGNVRAEVLHVAPDAPCGVPCAVAVGYHEMEGTGSVHCVCIEVVGLESLQASHPRVLLLQALSQVRTVLQRREGEAGESAGAVEVFGHRS